MQTESMQAPQGQELSYLYGTVPASHQHLGCAQTSEGIAGRWVESGEDAVMEPIIMSPDGH